MTASNGARFRITGSISGVHPSSAKGAILVAGETATLTLEDTLDHISNAKYEVVENSAAGAPAITFNPVSGIPTPNATSGVSFVVPNVTDPYSYKLRSTANRRVDANGNTIWDWEFERIIAIQPTGVRHITPSEETEFDPIHGWVQAYNQLATASKGGPLAHEQSTGIFRPETYGAKGDVQSVADGVTAAGDATVTSATAAWTAADVGKVIRIRGAAAAGADLQTTIASVTNATTIELTVAATLAVNPATIDWGTDDGAALQAWLTAVADEGGEGRLSSKRYGSLRNVGLTSEAGFTLRGNGRGASVVMDLRADAPDTPAPGGDPTGDYYGLLSFKSCSSITLKGLTVRGANVSKNRKNSGSLGRKGVYLRATSNFTLTDCEILDCKDEAWYADEASSGCLVEKCHIHDNNSNGINPASPLITDLRIIGNRIEDNQHSQILATAGDATITGNVIGCPGLVTYGADLVVLDASMSGVFADNALHHAVWDSGSCPLHIFGTPNEHAVLEVTDNTIRAMGGTWRVGMPGEGASIRVRQHSGTLKLHGNTIADIECIAGDNHCIWFDGVGATFVGSVDGNTLRGNSAENFTTAIHSSGGAAGAEVHIGDNVLPGWDTPYYNQDGTMVFSGECRISPLTVDHTTNPNPIPAGTARVLVDCSGGDVVCTLPPVAKQGDRELQFLDVKRSASTHSITIEGDGAEQVNGAANVVSTVDGAPINVLGLPDASAWVTTAPVS